MQILCPVCKKDITNKITKNNDTYSVRCVYYNITSYNAIADRMLPSNRYCLTGHGSTENITHSIHVEYNLDQDIMLLKFLYNGYDVSYKKNEYENFKINELQNLYNTAVDVVSRKIDLLESLS